MNDRAKFALKAACAAAMTIAALNGVSWLVTEPPPKPGELYVLGKKPDPWCTATRYRVLDVRGDMVKFTAIGPRRDMQIELVDQVYRFSCDGIRCLGQIFHKDTFNCQPNDGDKP